MNRRKFMMAAGALGASRVLAQSTQGSSVSLKAMQNGRTESTLPGIWRIRIGTPERFTPVSTRRVMPSVEGLSGLPNVTECPVKVQGKIGARGVQLEIPLEPKEAVYGFGLQLLSFMQRGSKKTLRTNADPKSDSGDTHAPVPFYVTTNGYGVLVDTARYPTFYCGNLKQKGKKAVQQSDDGAAVEEGLPAACRIDGMMESAEMVIEIPRAAGVDVYVFAGPTMQNAVQRYNLFSGGGVLPPRWALGFSYRAKSDYTQDELMALAREFRERNIPCDLLGLEPGWQTHAYSCSFVWSKNYPDPKGMLQRLTQQNYRVNLWEHAFVHPSSPIHDSLLPRAGDYEVWQGLTPDFVTKEGERIFADFHEKEHVELGVSGYKLDECDNSDFTGGWSFPETSAFPSGLDGEQMHSLFGQRYQDCLTGIFDRRRQRTFGLVRSSHALAAPYPYVLYSDLYDHRQYVRALANSGFSGLLWSSEVRDAQSIEDLVRRIQTTTFSGMAMINAWYIHNPPWKQSKTDENNRGLFEPGWEKVEAICREAIELRMRFLPYLHAAFAGYKSNGVPPFRALVMEWPEDPETWQVDDQILIGRDVLVAPAFAGEPSRQVYLPTGEWFDFWSEKQYTGKQTIKVEPPLNEIPIFVRAGTLLPLAQPTDHTADSRSWQLEVRLYGQGTGRATLYEDDGSYEPALEEVRLSWDGQGPQGSAITADGKQPVRYRVDTWKRVGG